MVTPFLIWAAKRHVRRPRIRVCACCVKANTVSSRAMTSWESQLKKDKTFVCPGEYASLVSAKATWHDTAKRKLNAMCKKPHANVLHRYAPEDKKEESTQETVRATNNCVNCSDTTTSMILPVWIHHKEDPECRLKVYAALDDQSDTCFITDDAINNLRITGPGVQLELGTMHSVEKIDTQRIDGLVVSRFDGKVNIPLTRAYSGSHIPSLRGQIPRPETARKYEHLERIADEIRHTKST